MSTLRQALDALAAGRPVVLPTDTVYGVGARPDRPAAIAAIFSAKGRPEDKALPVLGADLSALRSVGVFTETASLLGRRFWPGPLTLVVPRADGFDHDLGGTDAGTVAVRIPAFAPTLGLLRQSGPLAVTSANRSGEPPAATVDAARSALGHAIDVFVDGGRVGGAPSTVVSLVDGLVVLREGALSTSAITSVVDEGPG